MNTYEYTEKIKNAMFDMLRHSETSCPTWEECRSAYDSLPEEFKANLEWDADDHDVREEVGSFLFDKLKNI